MTRQGLGFWLLLGATVAVYAAMVLWSLPEISRQAGGLVPFDMRPTGYGADEAAAFLTALGDRGRALYLGRQHWLDTLYPGLLAATLVLALWRLTGGMPRWLRLALVLVPVAAAGFDWLENARVRAMLLAGPAGLTDAMAAAASRATLAKSVLTALAAVAVVAFLGLHAVQRLRRRG